MTREGVYVIRLVFYNGVMVLQDAHLEVRPMLEMKPKDWALFYKYFRDKEIAVLNGANPIFMPLWLFKNIVLGEEKSGERIGLAIYFNQVFIGSVEFYDIVQHPKSAVLGILIGEKRLWGVGLGTRALRLALQFIFAKDFGRITLETLDDNFRARSSFEKNGFRFIGTTNTGKYRFAKYELTKSAWLEQQNKISPSLKG
jgi:RimJ/RimL family protein N-acetyltransferase